MKDRPLYQLQIAKFILDAEARRDDHGHLAVYRLPAGDGGGTYEVAGINDRYDHDEAEKLREIIKNDDHDAEQAALMAHAAKVALDFASHFFMPAPHSFLEDTTELTQRLVGYIAAGRYELAEREAQEYYLENTDPVWPWMPPPDPFQDVREHAIEAFLRDTAFNRGVRGAAKILQRALGLDIDGNVGPVTRAALAKAVEHDPKGLLLALRSAQEIYERIVAPPVGARAKFWNGLVNRWNHRVTFAMSLLDQPAPSVSSLA